MTRLVLLVLHCCLPHVYAAALICSSLFFFPVPGGCKVFYGFIVKSVELWRPAVETSWASITNVTLEVTSLLIDTLAVQYPKLSSSVRDVVSAWVLTRKQNH